MRYKYFKLMNGFLCFKYVILSTKLLNIHLIARSLFYSTDNPTQADCVILI